MEYAELPDATPAAPAKKVSASYPQPAKWNDATAEVRSTAAKNGTGTIEGDWLQVTNLNKGAGFSLADGREFRNATVRLTFTRWANIHLRTSKDFYYSGGAGGGKASIELQGGTAPGQVNPRIATGTPIPNFDGEAEHEVVFAVQGDRITGWLDGVENITAHDGTATSGALSLYFQPADEARYQPRIKKVEYGELPESYPQPPKWTDATAALRSEALANGELVAEGEWLKATVSKGFRLAPGRQIKNPIVRILFSERADLWLKRTQTSTDDTYYGGGLWRNGLKIARNSKVYVPLAENYSVVNRLEGEHEAVFAAQGDTLTLWLDGKQVAASHDAALAVGEVAIFMSKGDPRGDSRIKKLEYGELPDTPPAK